MRSPLLASVIERLENDEFDVRKEAAWVIANILHGFATDSSATNAQRATALVQLGCIPGMVKMLGVRACAPLHRQRTPTSRLASLTPFPHDLPRARRVASAAAADM